MPGLAGIGFLNIVFIILTLLTFILALFGNARTRPIQILYEIISYVFAALNICKFIGIFLVLHYAFKNEL